MNSEQSYIDMVREKLHERNHYNLLMSTNSLINLIIWMVNDYDIVKIKGAMISTHRSKT